MKRLPCFSLATITIALADRRTAVPVVELRHLLQAWVCQMVDYPGQTHGLGQASTAITPPGLRAWAANAARSENNRSDAEELGGW